ncbi:MAG: signal peptide peptidase SppA [Elusimicrobia bacterium]|nr:signal peptide peptidase SppA [Elusimicrobiota bacterium]
MICSSCRMQLPDEATSCPHCGAPQSAISGTPGRDIPVGAGPADTPPPPQEPPRRTPRVWIRALAVLYGATVFLAVAVLLRGTDGAGSQRSGGGLSKRLILSARREAVGWISIHGPIYHSASGNVWDRGAERWGRKIRELAEKQEIKALVLDIDSPGGSVGAVQELYGAIQRVRQEKKKPVVAVVGDMAASGGYYLASACDKVVAHPGSLLGSIGVIFNSMNVQQLFAKLGIRADPIKSGKLKDIGSPTRPMTPEERLLLQQIIDDTYGQFLRAVSQGRGIPEEALRPIADGRIFNGRQAFDYKLVDQLGDSQDAVRLAGKLAGIVGTPRVVRDSDSLETVLGLLESSIGQRLRPETAILRELRDATRVGLEYRWLGF